MNSKKPFFSIILPTYNRGQFLSLAIESVLNQTFSDFELIVSNSASTDNTRETVQQFKDKRLRYFETKNRLSMGENYEHALNQSNGEYIIFFSDDDALIPTMLEKLEKVIRQNNPKLVVFPFAQYYHQDSREVNEGILKNTLSFASFTGETKKFDSKMAIKRMFSLYGLSSEPIDTKNIYPLIGNIACHYSIIEKLKLKHNKLFVSVPVDIYFITLVLDIIESYVILDEPLLVWSNWSQNSSISIKEDVIQHYELLLNGETLDFVPLKFATPMNCAANAVLNAKSKSMNSRKSIDVDWNWYFKKVYEELIYLNSEGVNISQEIEEFNSTLLKQPYDTQKEVKKISFNLSNLLKRNIKKRFPSLAKSLRIYFGKNKTSNQMSNLNIINGNNANFKNFLEGAQYLASILD